MRRLDYFTVTRDLTPQIGGQFRGRIAHQFRAFAGHEVAYLGRLERGDRFGKKTIAIDPGLLAATTALTKKMFNDVPVIPTMSTGATDGAYLRSAGIPTYGVSGIFSAPGETNAHGRDEKLRIKSYYDGLAFLYELVKQVSGPPGKPIS